MPSLWRKLWGCAPGSSSGHFSMQRETGDAGAWTAYVDDDDPEARTGIKFYPETDTFVVPSRRGRASQEIPGRVFLRRYPGGDAGMMRTRRLDELRMTGRIAMRDTDRWGNPWPADRVVSSRRSGSRHSHDSRHSSTSHHHSEHRSSQGPPSRRDGSSRRTENRGDAISVELPGIPEESEAGQAPLLLTQYPYWHEPSRHGSSRQSNRASSSHPSRVGSRQSSRR